MKIISIMMKIKKFFFTIIIFIPNIIIAQQDFASWNSVTFNYKIKKTTFSVSNEFRLNNNSSELDKYLCDFIIEQNLKYGFKIEGAMRYSRFYDLGFQNEYLYYGVIQYSYRIQRFITELQTKLQYGVSKYDNLNPDYSEWQWRNKITLNYLIPGYPIKAYLSYETFIRNKTILEFYKYRFFSGIRYSFNKQNNASVFYGWQDFTNKINKTFIVGIKYSLNINKKSKKNKKDYNSDDE